MLSKQLFDPDSIHPEAQIDMAVLVMALQGQGSPRPTFKQDFADKMGQRGFSQNYIADASLYAESVAQRHPVY